MKMINLRKASLHLLIIAATVLFLSQSCYPISTAPADRKPKPETEPLPNADVQTLTISGMNYLIVRTPEGAIMANLTKDSLEVSIRKRNDLYLELTNRHLKTNR